MVHYPLIRALYRRLIESGKPKIVALVAGTLVGDGVARNGPLATIEARQLKQLRCVQPFFIWSPRHRLYRSALRRILPGRANRSYAWPPHLGHVSGMAIGSPLS
jgi:hypothetical protein